MTTGDGASRLASRPNAVAAREPEQCRVTDGDGNHVAIAEELRKTGRFDTLAPTMTQGDAQRLFAAS